MVGLAQQFDVLDIRRDFGWRRLLRLGLGESVVAEHPWVNLAPELGVVAFPAAQVLDDQRFVSDARCKLETGSLTKPRGSEKLFP